MIEIPEIRSAKFLDKIVPGNRSVDDFIDDNDKSKSETVWSVPQKKRLFFKYMSTLSSSPPS